MSKGVCVGSLQSTEITLGRPRWSASFVKELEKTRDEDVEMQTLPEVPHRVVTCVTKRRNEIEVSLLDDLCKHMKK